MPAPHRLHTTPYIVDQSRPLAEVCFVIWLLKTLRTGGCPATVPRHPAAQQWTHGRLRVPAMEGEN